MLGHLCCYTSTNRPSDLLVVNRASAWTESNWHESTLNCHPSSPRFSSSRCHAFRSPTSCQRWSGRPASGPSRSGQQDKWWCHGGSQHIQQPDGAYGSVCLFFLQTFHQVFFSALPTAFMFESLLSLAIKTGCDFIIQYSKVLKQWFDRLMGRNIIDD